MAKKVVQKGVSGVVGKVKNIFGSTPEISQEDKLEMARKRLNEMVRILSTVEFENSKLSQEEIEKNGYEDACQDMINILLQPEIAADDMTRIDDVLMYACNAFAEAIRDGKADVADWSMYCLSKGLRDIRRDIADVYAAQTDPEMRAKQIEEKANWFDNYHDIIAGYVKYDDCMESINRIGVMRNERMDEYDAMQKEYDEFLHTAEGQRADAKLAANLLNQDASDDDVIKLKSKMNRMRNHVVIIKGLNADRSSKIDELNMLETDIYSLRQTLTENYHLYDPQLDAKFERARRERLDKINRRIANTADEQKRIDQYADALDAALNSSASKDILSRAVRFRDELRRQREREAEDLAEYQKLAEKRIAEDKQREEMKVQAEKERLKAAEKAAAEPIKQRQRVSVDE